MSVAAGLQPCILRTRISILWNNIQLCDYLSRGVDRHNPKWLLSEHCMCVAVVDLLIAWIMTNSVDICALCYNNADRRPCKMKNHLFLGDVVVFSKLAYFIRKGRGYVYGKCQYRILSIKNTETLCLWMTSTFTIKMLLLAPMIIKLNDTSGPLTNMD